MKRGLKVLAFIGMFCVFLLPLLLAVYLLIEVFLPAQRGPDGLYMPANWSGFIASMWLANRMTSYVFWKTGLSATRWTLFSRRFGATD